MDCDEPHLAPNEKTQPIQWTERPTGALVAGGSLWPIDLMPIMTPCGTTDGQTQPAPTSVPSSACP